MGAVMNEFGAGFIPDLCEDLGACRIDFLGRFLFQFGLVDICVSSTIDDEMRLNHGHAFGDLSGIGNIQLLPRFWNDGNSSDSGIWSQGLELGAQKPSGTSNEYFFNLRHID